MAKRLIKDIIIPKGTILRTAPSFTSRDTNVCFDVEVGLTKDTVGVFEYIFYEGHEDELNEYFEDIED